jgi:hypothetical protein
MDEVTQPRRARGKMLPVTAVAAALVALLAFAPLASATPDPVASGSTTLTLNNGWTKYLKTFGIKIQKVGNAKVKGQKATFKVTGGEMDPTNGLGKLTLSGGLKFKAGKKSTTANALVLETAKNVLQAKVGGKKVKLAKLSGLSFSRLGFGVKVNLKKLQLTNGAATQLNKKLGFAKGKPKPFLKNKLIAKSTSEDQPKTVTVLPTNSLIFNGSTTLLGKLSNVKANLELIPPTVASGTTFGAPLTGGTVAPEGTSGTVLSSLGLNLVQSLPVPGKPSINTKITLGAMSLDLGAKTVSVEVVAVSNAESPAGSGKFPLNLGPLGRSSIGDLTIGGVSTSPATRTVTVNSSATLQPVAAEVLQGFVSVYKAYVEGGTTQVVCEALPGKCATAPEKEIAAKKAKEEGDKVEQNKINAGESLGTFGFTAVAQ